MQRRTFAAVGLTLGVIATLALLMLGQPVFVAWSYCLLLVAVALVAGAIEKYCTGRDSEDSGIEFAAALLSAGVSALVVLAVTLPEGWWWIAKVLCGTFALVAYGYGTLVIVIGPIQSVSAMAPDGCE